MAIDPRARAPEPVAASARVAAAAHASRAPARFAEHDARVRRLQAVIAAAGDGDTLRLHKRTSNLFRDRHDAPRRRLDFGELDHVLAVDAAGGYVDVEGGTPYDTLVDATLAHARMPTVVPQLKSITIGGAVAGVGIEATSFRQGLVHERVLELDVLLPGGELVTCDPTGEHRDLYYGFPNSYGTLGYAMRVRAALLPVKPCVAVEHRRHADATSFFADVAAQCAGDADFVDGVVFGERELVLSVARFADEAPHTSDYTYERIYYRSLLERERDWLTTRDYLWRWDTDWFWCSKNVYAQHPWVRRLLGRDRLNSRTYTKIMRWNSRWGLTRAISRLRGRHPESVIQDVDIPIAHAAEFLAFLLAEIGVLPIWICPFRAYDPAARYDLYPADPWTLYVNFGFWDVIDDTRGHPPGHYNRLVEQRVSALGGIKSLYSDSYFPREEFDAIYGGERYAELKRRYDPRGRAPGLYEKCVLRH